MQSGLVACCPRAPASAAEPVHAAPRPLNACSCQLAQLARRQEAALEKYKETALQHEAQAAYDAKRYALLLKQHQDLLAGGRAQAADDQTATSRPALAQQQGLVLSLRAEARGAATELEQLRVRGLAWWLGRRATDARGTLLRGSAEHAFSLCATSTHL